MNSKISLSLQDKTDTDLKQLQSSTIDLLRFPLAIMVIFIHYSPKVVNVLEADFSLLSGQGISNIIGLVLYLLTSIAVPSFYLISGYLFFLNFQQWSWKGYGDKIRRRIKTLIIPYILWNLIPFLLLPLVQLVVAFLNGKSLSEISFFIPSNYMHIFYDYHEWSMSVNWLGERLISTGPYNLPLWFLRDLIVVTFCSPLIYCALKKFGVFTLLFLFFAYISKIWITTPGFHIVAFFYFTVGAYFALNRITIISFVNKRRFIFIPISLIILIVATLFFRSNTNSSIFVLSVFPLFTCSTVFSSFYVASLCIKKYAVKPKRLLVSSCFFIYALHGAPIPSIGSIIAFSKKMWHAIIPGDLWVEEIICYFLATFFAAAVCIFVLIISRKIIPGITLYFTGNK